MSSSQMATSPSNFLDSPIDVILEIAHHLELLEPQRETSRCSLMSLASCNTSLYTLLSPLVFRKLVFADDPYDSDSDEPPKLREMCTMLANLPSYTPPWLPCVKEIHFLDWSTIDVDESITEIYARAVGRFTGLESINFRNCFEVDWRFFDVIGTDIFPRHMLITNSPFRVRSLARAWVRLTDALEIQTQGADERTLGIHMPPVMQSLSDRPWEHFDQTPQHLLNTITITPQMAESLVSLSLPNSLRIDDVPPLLNLLRASHRLQNLLIEGVTCNSLRSIYDDPEISLRALREPALPHTSLPDLTNLRIPPGFLPFFEGPLTLGKPRQKLKMLDFSPYYRHDTLQTLHYIPVINVPFDCLYGKDDEPVPLLGVETLSMRIDRYLQWNLGEWFPRLKSLSLVDVSMASTSSFLKLLASHWPSADTSSRTYSLESLNVTSMPRNPQPTQVFQSLTYPYSELDLKWQVEGAKALSEGPKCLQDLRQFSCGDPVLWLRQPKPIREVAGSPPMMGDPNVRGSDPKTEATNAPENSASPSTPEPREASGWTAWKPHVDSDCVETMREELLAMWRYGFTELYSDYEGCLSALFTEEEVNGNLEIRTLVESLNLEEDN